MGFDPGSPGLRPGPKAGAKPLRHPVIPEYTFLSSAHGTFSRTDHIIGHKSALNRYNRFKKFDITPCIFFFNFYLFMIVTQGEREAET